MVTLEQKINILMEYAVAEAPDLKNRLRNEIIKMLSDDITPAPTESSIELSNVSDSVIRDVCEDILKELGAPCHLLGYEQVISALKFVIADSEYIDNITSRLYPAVGEIHHKTTSQVERSIRHLIEVAWYRQDLENAFRIFGYTIDATRGKPTNSEFIASCAKEAKRRIRNMQKEG